MHPESAFLQFPAVHQLEAAARRSPLGQRQRVRSAHNFLIFKIRRPNIIEERTIPIRRVDGSVRQPHHRAEELYLLRRR